ncbi:hypothetical protein GALL_144730 [mine drainage metagenome]|uniref:Secretion system C-terminal sorting domain-containing protein n=1 Tax=mine drainage metagenome TaxID=410659 RepID=A0A1J5S5K8_9ZZZZ
MRRFLWLFLLLAFAISSNAQYNYNTAGAVYSQNFDGLPSSGKSTAFPLTGAGPFDLSASPVNGSNLTGWQFYKSGGSGADAVFATGTGSDNSGNVYSFGAVGSANRALGTLPTSGRTYAIGFLVTNNTGVTLNSFTVSFTAEQWRNGGSNIANTWTFKYKIGSAFSNINQTSLTTNSNLNFLSVVSSASSSVLDGTLAANQLKKSFTISGITWNNGDQLILRWDDLNHSNSDAMAIDNFSFAAYPSSNIYTWSGGASGSYNVATNWTPNRNTISSNDMLVFNTAGNILIDNVQTQTIKNILISNAASVTLQNAAAATILTVSDNMNICSDAVLTAGTNCSLNIASTGSVNINGTLNTNNIVALKSDNTGSASIGISTGTTSGNTIVERFISSQRAYRLLSHPFNNNISLNNLLSYIDITGPAGNGFTNGGGNIASAYSYNAASDLWQAYTNASDTWNATQGLLLFIRGKNGEGLNGANEGSNNYPGGGPSNVIISLAGNLNIGNVNFTTGNTNTWNLIGNPYASPIDITQATNLITTAGSSNAYIYVWDATAQQTFKAVQSGAYVAKQLNSSIIIPSGAAFFVKNTTGTSQTITFTENCKTVNATPLSLFGLNDQNKIVLRVEKNNKFWDEVSLQFNDSSSSASTDINDLDKFNNANFNFYSIGGDKKNLAADARPLSLKKSDTILLGLNSTIHSAFTIKVSQLRLPPNTSVYLHDKFLNQLLKVDNNFNYEFEVTNDTASQGNDRFEIIIKKDFIQNFIVDNSNQTINIAPNPARDFIQITVPKEYNSFANIRIINSNGEVKKTEKLILQNNRVRIPVAELFKGIYFVEINDGGHCTVQKFIKE